MPDMGVATLNSNLPNPQRLYLWEVIIPNPVGGGDGNILTARAQSTNVPGRSFGNSIVVPFKQTAGIKYPGKLVYTHSWAVTFVEGEDHRVFDTIHAWNQQVINDKSGIGAGDENIKTNLYFTQISTKGQESKKIKLIGCYPESVADVAVGYGDEGVMNLVVTFSFDSWETV